MLFEDKFIMLYATLIRYRHEIRCVKIAVVRRWLRPGGFESGAFNRALPTLRVVTIYLSASYDHLALDRFRRRTRSGTIGQGSGWAQNTVTGTSPLSRLAVPDDRLGRNDAAQSVVSEP